MIGACFRQRWPARHWKLCLLDNRRDRPGGPYQHFVVHRQRLTDPLIFAGCLLGVAACYMCDSLANPRRTVAQAERVDKVAIGALATAGQ